MVSWSTGLEKINIERERENIGDETEGGDRRESESGGRGEMDRNIERDWKKGKREIAHLGERNESVSWWGEGKGKKAPFKEGGEERQRVSK